MKLRISNKYSIAAILIVGVAVVLIASALISKRGDITTAAVVISGMVCAMIGIFILMFSGDEPVDSWLVGILPAQSCINLCRIASDLGITGNANFLPQRVTGESRIMQFNSVSTYNGSKVSAQESFPKTGPSGLITIPSCEPLIQNLKKRNALVIPDKEEELTLLLSEAIGDIFEFALRVSAKWRGNTITITFHGYQFIEGCKMITQASPHCCAMHPCPACSLCGVLIAEGTDKVVVLDQCSTALSSQDVTAVFSIVPIPDD